MSLACTISCRILRGFAMQVIGLLLVISLLFPVVAPDEDCRERCSSLPKERRVECRLDSSSQFRWPTCDQTRFRSGPCAVYAGMDVELTCGDSSAMIHVHRVSSQGGLEAEVAGGVLRSVRVEDGGEYVCTDDGETVLHRRNVSVEGTAALATNDCSTTVTADLYCVDMDNAQCCRESRSLNILWGSIFAQGSYSLPIGVYGQPAPSPTLSLEWASPHRTLTAADLGMELQRSNESDTLYKLVVFADDTGYWPETIFYYNGTRAEPEATITLRAGEEGGASLPLCYPITFGDSRARTPYLVEPSLPAPQQVWEGEEANFSCRFSFPIDRNTEVPLVRVIWTSPDQIQENCTCSLFVNSHVVCRCSTLRHVTVTYHSSIDMIDHILLTLFIAIDSASANDSGSVLACLLETPGERSGDPSDNQLVVQWKQEASLTVRKRPLPSFSTSSPHPTPSVSPSLVTVIFPAYYAWAPPLAVLLALLVAVAMVAVLWVMSKKKKEENISFDCDTLTVPMRSLSHTKPHHRVQAPPTGIQAPPTSDKQSLASPLRASSVPRSSQELEDSFSST